MQKIKTDSWFISLIKSFKPTGKPLWLSWVSILCSFSLFFYPAPPEALFIAVLIVPLLGLVINRFRFSKFDSLIIVKTEYKKPSYYVVNFIFFPALALGMQCWAYHCANFFKIFEIGTDGFILMLLFIFALYGFIEKTNSERLGMYLFVIPVVALYTYAAVYVINCEFDNSAPSTFKVKIINKNSTTGKNSGYYLTVTGWEKHRDSDDVSISREKYYNLNIGEQIEVNYRNGLLTIPWYYYNLK